jgi:hypothetical protein
MPGYPKALADLQAIAARCANHAGQFPGARTLIARLRTAPTHSRLSEVDVHRVVTWIQGLAVPLR